MASWAEAAAENRVEVVDTGVDDSDFDGVGPDDTLVVQLVDAGHDVRVKVVVGVGRRGRRGDAVALGERRSESCGGACRSLRDTSAVVLARDGTRAGNEAERPGAGHAVDADKALENLLDGRLAAGFKLLEYRGVGDFDDGAVEDGRASRERARGREGWEREGLAGGRRRRSEVRENLRKILRV